MYENLNLIHWHLMQSAKNAALQYNLIQQYAKNVISFVKKGVDSSFVLKNYVKLNSCTNTIFHKPKTTVC